jgi:hypothetical protein
MWLFHITVEILRDVSLKHSKKPTGITNWGVTSLLPFRHVSDVQIFSLELRVEFPHTS